MDDSQETWPLFPFGDLDELAVLVTVLSVLALRVLPSTRKWAPRGNARRPARPAASSSRQENNDGHVLASRSWRS